VSAVHGFASTQLSDAPAAQTPPWHVSAPLQTDPSGHGVPFETATCWQPITGSQLSVVHELPSSQLSAAPGVQTPPWQVSAPLQTVLSAHDVPFATVVFWQMPALQTSFVHGFESLQSDWIVHGMQPAIGVWLHPVTASHASTVHALLSLQSSAVPVVHAPD
jgi:hypothetical protein